MDSVRKHAECGRGLVVVVVVPTLGKGSLL